MYKNLYEFFKVEEFKGMAEDVIILYHYALKFKFKNILDLGVGPEGNSTRAFSLAASQLTDYGSTVFSVDIDKKCIEDMLKRLQKLGLEKYVTFINDDSINVLKQSPFWFYDCIFMDTSHEYKQTLVELFWANLRLNQSDKGCIFIHDTIKPEVKEPIEIFLSYSPQYIHIEFNTEGGLGLLMKKSYFGLLKLFKESKLLMNE